MLTSYDIPHTILNPVGTHLRYNSTVTQQPNRQGSHPSDMSILLHNRRLQRLVDKSCKYRLKMCFGVVEIILLKEHMGEILREIAARYRAILHLLKGAIRLR